MEIKHKLRSLIAYRNLKLNDVSKELGFNQATFSGKLKQKTLKVQELEAIFRGA